VNASRLEQRRSGLDRANETLRARFELRRHWRRAGRAQAATELADLIECPPWWALTLKVFDALDAVPYIGPTRARCWMRHAVIPEGRVVGSLSDTQREALSQLALDYAHAKSEDLDA
jgi:hypothetical protein